MSRKVRADVDLNAIRHNYRLACAQAPRARAAAIVKANAYGHGAIAVARALEPEVPAFGVACIEEALELRAAGIRKPIMLLEGCFDEAELPLVDSQDFWPAVHSEHQLCALEQAQMKSRFPVFLKVDTGMHRLGFAPDQVPSMVERLQALSCVSEVILMTHFARSDEPDQPATAQQIECFEALAGSSGLAASLSNSAAVMAWPTAHRNWLRPGMMLYGATPFMAPQPVADQLQPAMTLSTEIIAIREVAVGERVGYGGTFVCERPTRIGTIAMGYGDGYPRHARNGTPVVVRGQRVPVAGRVSMDMMTIDLTDLPEARIGDRVELFGKQLPASEVAPWCDTIPYTLVTCLTPRVPRYYHHE
ncbi:alanine racemase [Marinobacterium zhoushanense]|uniref:Alanine racemase n=1 Tax=Marinobacterium zhoushanense TaxID=1679163 RepID=A0ABQ1JW87_9GAMM|nr:alanine racemase [Marinobacterium zhoushanense]GGB80159.1 alanine racemase [Marinobacterium zhoushanense]